MPFSKINKRILIFVSLFFFLNIGILYIYLHRVDRKYSILLEKELENFKYIQRITEASNRNFFLLSEMLDTKDTNLINQLKQERLNSANQNTRYFDSIVSGAIVDIKGKLEYTDIIEFRKSSRVKVEEFLSLLSRESNDSCVKYFYNILVPNHFKFQNKLEVFTDSHLNDLLKYSDFITNNVNKDSRSMLLFGFSPLLIVIISALVYLLLIIVAIVIFKWKPIEFD